jgi:hypothetical protein
MTQHELEHLELLAEVDTLWAELRRWHDDAPRFESNTWRPAEACCALLRRLEERTDALRVRIEAPLVVATLGGTGTGKSSLVNALVGTTVTTTGRQRPTTRQPILITRPDLRPELLGIRADQVEWVTRDTPALRDLVLLDCPDPDTTEDSDNPTSNTALLRSLLPHCDVLLVATTQQKYRSARVSEELAAAAPGARLVFVQTHADVDDDIRTDWRQMLGSDYLVGEMFFVDSLAALADAEAGVEPRGEFGRLAQFLARQLSGAAGTRIRRANFLDLVEQTLAACAARLDAALPAVARLETAIDEQRARLAVQLSGQLSEELLATRRTWEQRLLGEIASRWGFSPMSCVVRLYLGLGSLISGAALWRVRTPAQLALWGAFEGVRRLKSWQDDRAGELRPDAVSYRWNESELRTAAIIVAGYSADAGLPRADAQPALIEREAARAAEQFVTRAAEDVQGLVARLAERHSGWFARFGYELAILLVVGGLGYRFGRNFFFDSWLAVEFGLRETAAPLLGTDFFLGSTVVLLLWCGLLLWMFQSRLQRGLRAEITQLANHWNTPAAVGSLFAASEAHCQACSEYRQRLKNLLERVAALRVRIEGTGGSGFGVRVSGQETGVGV